MNKWKDTTSIHGVGDKLDKELDIVLQKAITAAKTKLQGYESIIQRKTGLNVAIEIDWGRWAHHKNFISQPIVKQKEINDFLLNKRLNDLINGDCGFCELYLRADAQVKATMKEKIKKIVVAYNPENNINEGEGSEIELLGKSIFSFILISFHLILQR